MLHSEVLRPPIPVVVQQHVEESAMLRHVRKVLVRAPHVKLHQLRRLDERIAAHLDGIVVAGAYGSALCTQALAAPGAGEVFAATANAIETRDTQALDRLLALADVLPDAKRGLLSAFGWVSAAKLQGIARTLLESKHLRAREVGISACRLHLVDPGAVLAQALGDPDAGLRCAALRAAGELGRRDLIGRVQDAISDESDSVRFAGALAACLLGDRGRALQALEAFAQLDGEPALRARSLVLQASEFGHAREILRGLARDIGAAAMPRKRSLIQAIGWLGDTRFVPWLIDLMADGGLCRLAGEAFTLMTGADLAALDLERRPPLGWQSGPSDNPDDEDVALDEDESLPWPDRDRVSRWWAQHAAQLEQQGRVFMGASPSPEHCMTVLRTACQRQRVYAARLACLLQPGLKLFATCAPAWRQQRQLGPAA